MLTTVLALDEVLLESSLCSVALNVEFPEIGARGTLASLSMGVVSIRACSLLTASAGLAKRL
jgi:hypothetical protein